MHHIYVAKNFEFPVNIVTFKVSFPIHKAALLLKNQSFHYTPPRHFQYNQLVQRKIDTDYNPKPIPIT